MSVKEVRPGETNNDNPLQKKPTREIGTSGLDELAAKVQAKIEQKVDKVTSDKGSAVEAKKTETPELKKQYFGKATMEKNMSTSSVKALTGNMSSGTADARNLKIIVLPKLEKMADPSEVGTFGGKANMSAPFKFDLSDLLSRTLGEIELKPNKFLKRLDKLGQKAIDREKKFGKVPPPPDRDANEWAEEEYNRRKKSKAVAKMFELMNKALGMKMDKSGAPADFDAKPKAVEDDEDD